MRIFLLPNYFFDILNVEKLTVFAENQFLHLFYLHMCVKSCNFVVDLQSIVVKTL